MKPDVGFFSHCFLCTCLSQDVGQIAAKGGAFDVEDVQVYAGSEFLKNAGISEVVSTRSASHGITLQHLSYRDHAPESKPRTMKFVSNTFEICPQFVEHPQNAGKED